MTTTPDPVTDVWELLHTAACDYRDQAKGQRSEARLIDALMPVVKAYGDARAAAELRQDPTLHCSEDGTPGVTRESCPWHPAEPTGGLREALAAWLYSYNREPLIGWDQINEPARDHHRDGADALLAGPLAPLLAKLRAVEALADELEREATVIAVRAGVPPLDFVRLWRDDAPARIRAAIAAPVAQAGDGR